VLEQDGSDSGHAVKNEREVFFSEAGGMIGAKVYDLYQLRCGNQISGPAIVEEVDSTVVIHPGYHARVDRYGNLLIEEQR
jgi:N-methylhydantoinase A